MIGNRATAPELDDAVAAIEADPRNWVAQPILSLSTAPTLVRRRASSRATSTCGRSSSPARRATSRPAGSRGWRCRRARWSSTRRRAAAARTPGSSTACSASRRSSAPDDERRLMALLARVADRLYWGGALHRAGRGHGAHRPRLPRAAWSTSRRRDAVRVGAAACDRRQTSWQSTFARSDDYVAASWPCVALPDRRPDNPGSIASCVGVGAREPAHDARGDPARGWQTSTTCTTTSRRGRPRRRRPPDPRPVPRPRDRRQPAPRRRAGRRR